MATIDADIEQAKAALRVAARERRAAMPAAERAEAAEMAAAHFFSGVELDPNETIALYWPVRDELDCRPVLTRLVDSDQPVCLPVVLDQGQPLELRLWEAGVPLYPSGFGTLAPPEDAPVVVPHVVLMPLLGFDKRGTRLGYGGGYYDRTLQGMPRPPRLIGYAYACQEIDHVPRDGHDVPLDAVVTEAGYRSFADAA